MLIQSFQAVNAAAPGPEAVKEPPVPSRRDPAKRFGPGFGAGTSTKCGTCLACLATLEGCLAAPKRKESIDGPKAARQPKHYKCHILQDLFFWFLG